MKSPFCTTLLKFGLTACCATVVAGCASTPPTQEMSDARQSIEAAESIGAGQHAPAAFDSAQQLLHKAQAGIQAGDYQQAQKEALAAREAARQAVAITQSKQAEAPLVVATPTAEPAPQAEEAAVTAQPSAYTVANNDSLWKIAAQPSVYADPLLWPLLLKENAGKIKNADLIRPGLVLEFDAEPSAAERDAARRHAKQRGKGLARQADKAYLQQYGLR